MRRSKKTLKKGASPRHVPQLILETPADGIPYTFSNKKVEIAVTKILHGLTAANKNALRNPESLEYYKKIKDELK